MFCPRCSQEQINPEIRFCSRCGFPLSDVAEALDNDGFVDRNTRESINGLRLRVSIGIALMSLSLVFFIASLVIGTPEPSHIVQFNLFVTLMVFLLGLAWVGFSLWRGFGAAGANVSAGRKLGSKDAVTAQLPSTEPSALPDSYTPPARVRQERELVTTVTEDTTKFFDSDR